MKAPGGPISADAGRPRAPRPTTVQTVFRNAEGRSTGVPPPISLHISEMLKRICKPGVALLTLAVVAGCGSTGKGEGHNGAVRQSLSLGVPRPGSHSKKRLTGQAHFEARANEGQAGGTRVAEGDRGANPERRTESMTSKSQSTIRRPPGGPTSSTDTTKAAPRSSGPRRSESEPSASTTIPPGQADTPPSNGETAPRSTLAPLNR